MKHLMIGRSRAWVLPLFCVLFMIPNGLFAQKKASDKQLIAVCDWMILKRQKIGEFELAKQLGADGVELDMGSLGQRDSFDNKLRKPEFQLLFKQKINETGIKVSSVAMSGFYAQSFALRANYADLVADCLATMKVMNVHVAYLPLGVNCDLNLHPELRKIVVERLRTIAKMAERAKCVIAIETSLEAKEEVELLQEVGSPAIKISFNFQNPLTMGRNIYSELQTLGTARIAQIHCTDTDDVLLKDNKRLDMQKIRIVLNQMKWKGWLIVERSRDKTDVHNINRNYGSNILFLNSVFNCK